MNTEINNHGVLHLRDDCVTPMMSNVALRVLPASTTLEFKVKHSILSDLFYNVVDIPEIRLIS